MANQLTPFTNNGGSYIPPRQYLSVDQTIRSPNGQFHLQVHGDGNVGIYDNGQLVWVANTTAPYSYETYNTAYWDTRFSNTYNLVLQDGTKKRTWISQSSSLPYPGAGDFTYAYLQDDGNLVCVTFAALWATNTSIMQIPFGPEVLVIAPGAELVTGQFYGVGSSRLIFQSDGNLVLYGENNAVLWASYTHGQGATSAVMQPDGNFVIYNAAGVALWHTSTSGNPGAYVQIQSNGNFIIASQTVTWARFGFEPTLRKPPRVFYPDNSTGDLSTFKSWTWTFPGI